MHLDPSVTVMRCPLALLDVTATSYEKYGQYNVNWPPHASPTPALTLKLTKRWFSRGELRGVIGTIREIEHASNYKNLWNSVV